MAGTMLHMKTTADSRLFHDQTINFLNRDHNRKKYTLCTVNNVSLIEDYEDTAFSVKNRLFLKKNHLSEEKVRCLVAVETKVCHSQLTLSCLMESSTYLITIMFGWTIILYF